MFFGVKQKHIPSWWIFALVAQDLDAVVLALGAGGMKAVLRGSPQVAKVCPNLSSAGAKRQGDGPGWIMFCLRSGELNEPLLGGSSHYKCFIKMVSKSSSWDCSPSKWPKQLVNGVTDDPPSRKLKHTKGCLGVTLGRSPGLKVSPPGHW